MGGSGGFFFESSKSPEDISKKIRNEEKRSSNQAYETEVTGLMRDLLTNINNRDVETIQTHLSTIENALHTEIDGFIDLKYAGSVSKHTYVDGLSDIDSLAILNNSELAKLGPNEVKDYFYKMLRKRLPNSDISIGRLCVTITFKTGVEIQILPTLKDKSGIKIPSSRRENEWSHVINPRQFALALRYMNIQMSGKLVPVIKLAKSVISTFPETRKLSGYHVEALAIETFMNYEGPKNPKAMLKHFFDKGSEKVLTPIRDKSGQSIHVDNYLGDANSINRKMVSDSMSTVSRKMHNADGSSEIRIWEQILK
jgi:ribosomal protein S20